MIKKALLFIFLLFYCNSVQYDYYLKPYSKIITNRYYIYCGSFLNHFSEKNHSFYHYKKKLDIPDYSLIFLKTKKDIKTLSVHELLKKDLPKSFVPYSISDNFIIFKRKINEQTEKGILYKKYEYLFYHRHENSIRIETVMEKERKE